MSEITQDAAPAAEQPVLPSVGERLQQARQSQGLSLGEMARQLKLSVKQVEALERNDYRSFPGALWVRGFLRNYAKALGLDAEDLVAKAGLATESKGESAAMVPTPAEPARERRRMLMLTLGFIVVGLFVLGLLGQRAGDRPAGAEVATPGAVPAAPVAPPAATTTPTPVVMPEATPQTDVTSTDVASPAPVESAPGMTTIAPSSVNPAPEQPAAAAPAVPAALPATAPVTSPVNPVAPPSSVPAAQPAPTAVTKPAAVGPATTIPVPATVPASPAVPASPVSSAPITASPSSSTPDVTPATPSAVVAPVTTAPDTPPVEEKPRTIRFVFSQSVDMVVRDSTGKVLLGSLQAAGTEKSVRGIPPFKVYMGNVNAVKYTYRGREVDPGATGRTGAGRVTLK